MSESTGTPESFTPFKYDISFPICEKMQMPLPDGSATEEVWFYKKEDGTTHVLEFHEKDRAENDYVRRQRFLNIKEPSRETPGSRKFDTKGNIVVYGIGAFNSRGQPHGLWKDYYYADDHPESNIVYEDGRYADGGHERWMIEKYRDMRELSQVNSEIDPVAYNIAHRKSHKTDYIKVVKPTLNGNFECNMMFYYPDGALRAVMPCKNNKAEGFYKKYDTQSRLISMSKFCNGKKIGPHVYRSDYKLDDTWHMNVFENGEQITALHDDFSARDTLAQMLILEWSENNKDVVDAELKGNLAELLKPSARG